MRRVFLFVLIIFIKINNPMFEGGGLALVVSPKSLAAFDLSRESVESPENLRQDLRNKAVKIIYIYIYLY